MLIECPHCNALVDGELLGEREYYPFSKTDQFDPQKYVFLECPSCSQVLLGLSMLSSPSDGDIWELPVRLWPVPKRWYEPSVPKLVRTALNEADRCFQAGAFSAVTVMCGRTIEAICLEKTDAKSLSTGLTKMREKNIIDDRLFAWGDALRKERNLSAHATVASPTRQDASDMLDFAWAIVDYVYILSEKFSEYKKRK